MVIFMDGSKTSVSLHSENSVLQAELNTAVVIFSVETAGEKTLILNLGIPCYQFRCT